MLVRLQKDFAAGLDEERGMKMLRSLVQLASVFNVERKYSPKILFCSECRCGC